MRLSSVRSFTKCILSAVFIIVTAIKSAIYNIHYNRRPFSKTCFDSLPRVVGNHCNEDIQVRLGYFELPVDAHILHDGQTALVQSKVQTNLSQ